MGEQKIDTHALIREEALSAFREMNGRLNTIINAATEAFANTVADCTRKLQSAAATRMTAYPALVQYAGPLAREGWFISSYFGLSEVDQVASAAESGSIIEIASVLSNLYAVGMVSHGHDVVADYPARAFAILPAIAAHRRGEYALSVPVFFAQAEGICLSCAGAALFYGGQDTRLSSVAQAELANFASSPDDGLFANMVDIVYKAMWTSVSEKLPIAYNLKERSKHEYLGLNRNTVLHGIASEEYATEENSLKAFSLLSCVAALMPRTFT